MQYSRIYCDVGLTGNTTLMFCWIPRFSETEFVAPHHRELVSQAAHVAKYELKPRKAWVRDRPVLLQYPRARVRVRTSVQAVIRRSRSHWRTDKERRLKIWCVSRDGLQHDRISARYRVKEQQRKQNDRRVVERRHGERAQRNIRLRLQC